MGKEREDFLIEMYKIFWENVNRSEGNMWQIVSFYIAIITGIFVATKGQYLDMFLGVMIILIFSFAAIYIILTAQLWAARNMGLISNIEKEFLKNDDYGTIFPTSFTRKVSMFKHPLAYFYISWILILIISLLIVFHCWQVYKNLWEREFLIIIFMWIFGFVASMIFLKRYLNKHKEFMREAPGRKYDIVLKENAGRRLDKNA